MMISWKPASGGQIPDGAFVTGWEANGIPLFTARAEYECALIPGKVRVDLGAACIPYKGKEIRVNPYEVLVGPAIWKKACNGEIPDGAIAVGRDVEGHPSYAARAEYYGGLQPGKIVAGMRGALIPFGCQEILIDAYEVLSYDV